MLKETLIIVLLIALIVFVISLIVLVIKLVGTLNKADYLIDNVTRKAESLDGVFSIIDSFNSISGTIGSYLIGFAKKLFNKKRKDEEDE